ncbi:MAG: glycosyltransferase family 4 protein [Chloroflexota bacterium]
MRAPETIRLVHITTVPLTLDFISEQIGYMQARGFEVHVLSSPGELLDKFAAANGIPAHGIEMPRRITPLCDLKAIFQIWRCLRWIRPQIVHAHTPKGGLLGLCGAWLAGVPVRIYHLHGLPFMTARRRKRILLRWSEKISCRLAHQVFCVSPSIREVVVAEELCPPAKIKVLLNGSISGVDAVNRFNPRLIAAATRRAVRARYDIPAEAQIVTFAGRIVRDKGLIELIAAWKTLHAEFPALHLLVAGCFEPQDPLPVEVEYTLRTDPRIHLTGWLDDMPAIYAATDVLVLPTYREGLGMTPLEAAAMETPVVATRIPGCIDSVQDRVTGMLVPPCDVKTLTEAIRLYLTRPDLRRKHGQAGRERVLRDFRPADIFIAQHQEYIRLLQAKSLASLQSQRGIVKSVS